MYVEVKVKRVVGCVSVCVCVCAAAVVVAVGVGPCAGAEVAGEGASTAVFIRMGAPAAPALPAPSSLVV